MSIPAVQDHYPDDVAHCYGCGRLNEQGYRLKTRVEGEEAVTIFTPSSHHTAVPGFVYGGLIASLIDCHSMATAAAAAERVEGREIGMGETLRFVTASLRVDYLAPTPLGPALEIRGRVREGGGKKYIVESTLSAGGKVTARGEVVAVRMPETMGRGPAPG
jgi:acyl-coenzyme A thioesterase PaaI-like protein